MARVVDARGVGFLNCMALILPMVNSPSFYEMGEVDCESL